MIHPPELRPRAYTDFLMGFCDGPPPPSQILNVNQIRVKVGDWVRLNEGSISAEAKSEKCPESYPLYLFRFETRSHLVSWLGAYNLTLEEDLVRYRPQEYLNSFENPSQVLTCKNNPSLGSGGFLTWLGFDGSMDSGNQYYGAERAVLYGADIFILKDKLLSSNKNDSAFMPPAPVAPKTKKNNDHSKKSNTTTNRKHGSKND